MKKTILSVLFCTAAMAEASAQITIAPELGLNMANMSVKSLGVGTNNTTRPGFEVGGVVDIPFNPNLSLQPGLYFMMNRSYLKSLDPVLSDEVNMTYNIKTFQVPVNLEYKFGTAGHNRLFIGGGPYLGYNAGGNIIYTGGITRSLNIGTKGPDAQGPGDDIKPLDFGLGINAGYMLKNGLYVRARYQAGIANLAPGTIEYNSIKMSSFGLSVGYSFGSKKSTAHMDGTSK
jgi:hypothetical protein